MKLQLLIVGISCVFGTAACKKADDGKAQAAAKGTAEVAKPVDKAAAPAPSGCSANAWKEPGGAFCIDVPAGFKAEVEKTEEFGADDPTMNVSFEKEGEYRQGKFTPSFTILWYPNRDLTEKQDIVDQMNGDYADEQGEDKGELAGGKGQFIAYALKDDAKAHRMKAIVEGKKHIFRCESRSYDEPIAAEIVAACKSLTPTE